MKPYANLHMYTDVRPYEVIRVVSDKTIELRQMNAERDPTWKPDTIIGGFAGHTVNNHTQRYTYSVNEDASIIRARLRKDGYFHSKLGRHVLSDNPIYFYDYNF